MLLSVIIPVYNTKDTLPRCIESVLAQQIPDMEIICVDDGSTDGSGEALRRYAGLDSRIKVIHQANAGLVSARKRGIRDAKGKYTGYVDSDDWVEPDMYGTFCRIAEQYGTDMVSGGYILEKGMQVKYYDGFPEGLYRGEELETLRSQIFFREENRESGIRPSLCCKLFRTSLLRKVQMSIPDEVTNCEDRLCTAAYMLEAESAYILKNAFYHYIYHKDSMSRRDDPYYLDKIGRVYRAFCAMYPHPKFSEKLRKQCELYIISKVMDGLNSYMGFQASDLMWIDYRWIEKFPEKSKIALYGAGRLGKVYYRQIVSGPTGRLELAGWVDRDYQKLAGYPGNIDSPEALRKMEFDYVLLAFADREPAEEVRRQLTEEFGIEEEKIVWILQHEVFWEYAKAAGMISGKSR